MLWDITYRNIEIIRPLYVESLTLIQISKYTNEINILGFDFNVLKHFIRFFLVFYEQYHFHFSQPWTFKSQKFGVGL